MIFRPLLSLLIFIDVEIDLFQNLFDSISKCRFEATDLNHDEIALMKLTRTLQDALSHPLAIFLTDAHVCTAVETVFRLCFQSRFSEFLRQSSCFEALGLVRSIFSHLPRLVKQEGDMELVPIKPIALPFTKLVDGFETPHMESKPNLEEAIIVHSSSSPVSSSRPFGLTSLVEILKFFSKLLDGGKMGGDEKVRCLSLDALGIVLEQTVHVLPTCLPLFRIVSTFVLRNLCILISTESGSTVLRRLVHPTALLFRLYRRSLVAHFDYLLHCIMEALGTKAPANPKQFPKMIESKLVLLELLLEFIQDENLIGDLFVYYECDLRYTMTLSELVAGLCELALNVDPRLGGSESTAMMAMQLLNRLLYELARHAKELKMDGDLSKSHSSEPTDFNETRKSKLVLQEAVNLFNKKPKEAFSYLTKQGIVSETPTIEEIAKFLRRTPGLDKRQIGEYLAKPGNEDILAAFMNDFEFQIGETIDEALRKVLESFRLPGEAQQIDRVVEAFGQAYYDAVGKDSHYASVDATYVLAFSIVMLNTDLYNPQNQRRMTMEEFIRNNRGINDGNDFEEQLLKHIYTQIATREIVLPEENQSADHAWKEMLRRADSYSAGIDELPSLPFVHPSKYLTSVIGLLFNQLVQCYLPVGEQMRTEELNKITFSGIDLLAIVLADLELHPLMAELIEALWQATGIPSLMAQVMSSPKSPSHSVSMSPAVLPPTAAVHAVKVKIIKHLTRSESCAHVLRTLFGIVHSSGPTLRAGWRTFVAALFAFADSSLLHLEMVDPTLEDEIRKVTSLSVKPGTPFEGSTGSQQNGGSIFSAFSSYIVSSGANNIEQQANANPPPAANEPLMEPIDMDMRRRALKIIRDVCQLDKILQETRYFQEDSLHALLQALSQGLLFKASTEQSMIIILEILVYVAWQNRDRLAVFWPTLSSCLSDLSKLPYTDLTEHAVMGLGRICLWLADRSTHSVSAEAAPLYFSVLCHVAPETFHFIAEPAASLALSIVQTARPIIESPDSKIWPHYFTLLSQTSRLRSCDSSTLGLLILLIPESREQPLFLPMEFFGEFVDLLIMFIGNTIRVPVDKVTHLSLASKDTVQSATVSESSTQAAIQCLDRLYSLQLSLINTSPNLNDYVTTLHSEVSKLGTHPSRVLRQQSLSLLQRLILSVDFSSNVTGIQKEFDMVLLPLLTAVTEVQSMPDAFEETQMHASSILCKTILHNLSLLLSSCHEYLLALWSTSLTALLNLMTSGRSDILRESIPESIKNVLLVMATYDGIMRSPINERFWLDTWAALDPVIPRLHQDLLPLFTTRTEPVEYIPEKKEVEHTNIDETTETKEIPEVDEQLQESDPTASHPHDQTVDEVHESPIIKVSVEESGEVPTLFCDATSV